MMDRILELYNDSQPPKRELIKRKRYKGIEYFITWFVNHPNCYIRVPKKHILYGKHYMESDFGKFFTDEDGADLEPHGCFTYSDKCLPGGFGTRDGWFIGWDYAHCCDYVSNSNGYINDGIRHSTNELEKECRDVIGVIKNISKFSGDKE